MSETETSNFKVIALILVLSSSIGFGISISAYFLICDDCESFSKIFYKEKISIEEICLNDPSCKTLDSVTKVDGKNFTPIGKEKVRLLQEMINNPIIQQALRISNEKDAQMSEDIRIQIYIQREKEWENSELTPFMKSVIYNDVSDFLRNHLIVKSELFNDVKYGEHILTNVYGGNVAISIKTDNYDQSNDDWWQKTFHSMDDLPFARECEFDSSAEIFSEDIVIKIKDIDSDEFIGILNSATECDVLYDPES